MEIAKEIVNIRKDLDMLLNLYSKLVDKILPEEEPEKEDIEAISNKDEILGEREFFRALEK
ncbi:MAG: hypothetical protein JRI56_12330 [Deltaproteobacteria bacterium]|nr:hypothetical protein [Deltaproteobacteria bacterium]